MMKRMYKSSCLLFGLGLSAALCFIPAAVWAQDSAAPREYNDHEIMVELGVAKTVTVQLSAAAQIDVTVPSGWQWFVHDNESMDFKVPYHTGVWGHIEVLQEESSVDADIRVMENALNTSLESVDTQSLETTHVSGTLSVLNGRSGGEMWQFMLVSGRLKNGRSLRFYAMCPQRWFAAYRLFFEDIVRSVDYPIDRHKR